MSIEKNSPLPQKDIIRTNEDVREYAVNELSKDKIEAKGTDWQEKIDSVLDTFQQKKANPELNAQDMEQAEKMIQSIPAVEFLKRSPDDLRALFFEGDTVNFHGNEGAKRFVGAGDLFPHEQQFLSIDGVVGKRSVSDNGKVGYLDKSGAYLPIFGGEKINLNVSPEEQATGFENIQTLTVEDEQKEKGNFQDNLALAEKFQGEAYKMNVEMTQEQKEEIRSALLSVAENLHVPPAAIDAVMRIESG